MQSAVIVRESPVQQTPRVLQLMGMFDLPASKVSRCEWRVELPLHEKPWNIGLIVGPSGCGKSTIIGELFGKNICRGFKWPEDKSVVDAFPAGMSIKEITALLSSVGFSSPPSWLRPFAVLSNGEQFRVTIARALAETGEQTIVIDEFTSVVDRTVARIGSAAVAKTIRRRNQKLIAVTCHYDVLEWLQPDWVYQPPTGEFAWRSLQRHPAIAVKIVRVDKAAWELFRHHHYLDRNLHKAAKCFVAMVEDQPAAFTAVLPFPHHVRPGWREHRTVCLPDFQGVGLGNLLSDFVAGMFRATGKPYFSTTSHPAMIGHRGRAKNWICKRHGRASRYGRNSRSGFAPTGSSGRLSASFEFVGEVRPVEAKRFQVIGGRIE